MIEQNRPAYYAIIPSNIRYCEELKFAERLLYGEITALCGKEGYCFATNRYFAELYGVIPGTISRWISHLESLKFIKVKIIKNERKQILERRIYINDIQRDVMPNTYMQNKQYPYEQNNIECISQKAKHYNIDIRIDRFFIYLIKKEKQNPENMTKDEEKGFENLLENFEFNYTEELINIFTEENIEKLKIIIYALKDIYISTRKKLITKLTRNELIFIYDKCKAKQNEYKNTPNEIDNFYEYYYTSLVRKIES